MNESTDEATLRFYDQEAERYCERTGTGPTVALGDFLRCLPLGAEIRSCIWQLRSHWLELGCARMIERECHQISKSADHKYSATVLIEVGKLPASVIPKQTRATKKPPIVETSAWPIAARLQPVIEIE